MWIGKTKFENPTAERLVEQMRKRLANEFGVTVQGSLVTLRWSEYKNGPLIHVTMSICDVDDGEPDPMFEEDK